MSTSALDDLLAEFESNAGSMPQVNPPEAKQVLATQTAPEVAGAPEPEPEALATPAPTEKPAEVKAAEAPKTRKPRGSKAAAPAAPPQAPDGWDNTPKVSGLADPKTAELTTDQLVAALQDRGYSVTLTASAK